MASATIVAPPAAYVSMTASRTMMRSCGATSVGQGLVASPIRLARSPYLARVSGSRICARDLG
eukprot:161128-Heterocapsa_arctica.AAC.1